MNKITVSSPGKLHLLGEHTVVYGKPAIIAAVDKRCYVTISPRNDKKISITINHSIQKQEDSSWFTVHSSEKEKISSTMNNEPITENFIVEKTNQAQKQWQEFIKTENIDILKNITKNPLNFVPIGIGETLQYYNKKIPSGFDLSVTSDIPIGSGMGSSAALAVSLAGAVSLLLGEPLDKEKINEIAFLIEQKKHGRPSGGDNTASCYGGLIWYQKKSHPKDDQPLAEVIIKPLSFSIPKNITEKFFIINTGMPEESTGEMVALVRSKFHPKDDQPLAEKVQSAKFKKILDVQEQLVRQLSSALENDDSTLMIHIIRAGERNLEKLGVVSESTKQLIKTIEKAGEARYRMVPGGAAKICGAGGRKKASGIVLAFHENRKVLEDLLQSLKIPFSEIRLGEGGVRIE